MSKKFFSEEEVEILKKNKYVRNVSPKAITYSDEFKYIFIEEHSNGMLPLSIFIKYGFDPEILGSDRIKGSSKRWRRLHKKNGIIGLDDSRKSNSGRPRKTKLTVEEELERLRAQNELLKAENELLKKLEKLERVVIENRILLPSRMKFELIKGVIEKYRLKNMVRYLCGIAEVSRSGYYNYFCEKSQENRLKRDQEDEIVLEIILKAYRFKRRKKGAKLIKTTLAKHFGINYNLKRIRRIMKKYNIVCSIRKANPYRRMLKATKEHSAVENVLNREFKQETPGKVLLTDITYLNYGMGHRAYLSTILDSSTNEVVAYNVSKKIDLKLVTDTIQKLLTSNLLRDDSFIHSDQGAHYTSPRFKKLLKENNLGQSMSRRGNCWDNAPQESFFGHFKDETHLKSCKTYDDLLMEVDDYMDYHNNYRCQWNQKKMTPSEYRNHLLNVA